MPTKWGKKDDWVQVQCSHYSHWPGLTMDYTGLDINHRMTQPVAHKHRKDVLTRAWTNLEDTALSQARQLLDTWRQKLERLPAAQGEGMGSQYSAGVQSFSFGRWKDLEMDGGKYNIYCVCAMVHTRRPENNSWESFFLLATQRSFVTQLHRLYTG